jgi:hypothetical protein
VGFSETVLQVEGRIEEPKAGESIVNEVEVRGGRS